MPKIREMFLSKSAKLFHRCPTSTSAFIRIPSYLFYCSFFSFQPFLLCVRCGLIISMFRHIFLMVCTCANKNVLLHIDNTSTDEHTFRPFVNIERMVRYLVPVRFVTHFHFTHINNSNLNHHTHKHIHDDNMSIFSVYLYVIKTHLYVQCDPYPTRIRYVLLLLLFGFTWSRLIIQHRARERASSPTSSQDSPKCNPE